MRQKWVDIARGIGIILVVYGHVLRGIESARLPVDSRFFQISDRLLYSFHMPLFFVLSGYFFEASIYKNGICSFITNKIRTLLYPYFLWSFLQTGIELLLARYTNGSIGIDEFLRIFYNPRAQFWFLIALFNVSLLTALLYYVAPRRYLIIVGVIWMIFKLTSSNWEILSDTMEYSIFFIFGVLLNSYKVEKHLTSPISMIVLGVVITLFSLIYLSSYPNLAIKFFLGIIGTLSVITIAIQTAVGKQWLGYLGRQSLPIYLAHILAGSGTRIILYKFLGVTSVTTHLIIGTLVGVFAPLLLYRLSEYVGAQALFYFPKNISKTRTIYK